MTSPPHRLRRPTSIDVAALAKVSQSTVSRALRGDRSITAETRQRVVRIAAQLGYYPDSRAVRLREGWVRTLAVILLFSEEDEHRTFNPFYYEIASAVEVAAARRGIGVLLSCQSQASSLRGDFERRREADGIILIGTAANRQGWDFFARQFHEGVNIVGWGAPDDSLPTVRADNRSAGEIAAAHLVSVGRRRLAFVGPGWCTHAAFRLRREGFLAALEQQSLSCVPVNFEPDTWERVEQGEAWIKIALAHAPELDGIFAASDALAAGVMRGLVQEGRKIPKDVAVVGFDGGYSARHCIPALTTLEQNVAEAGELLVDAVLSDRAAPANCLMRAVSIRLAIRESSGS